MLLTWNSERERYETVSTYDERHIAKGAWFRWDVEERVWYTNRGEDAAKLAPFADELAQRRLEEDTGLKPEVTDEDIEASLAVDADIMIPAPKGLEYFPYQLAGIAYADDRTNTLLADEMGLGKTIQAIGFANMILAQRILVACPANLKLNWYREMTKWLTQPLSIDIAKGKYFPEFSDVVIINYDILHNHEAALRERHWDLLIGDEAHYLKNSGSRRSKHFLGGLRPGHKELPRGQKSIRRIEAERVMLITGTPIVNRPKELYPLLHRLDKDEFSSFKRFTQEYCGGYETMYGYNANGATNLSRLHRKLRASVMVRRLKEDVLKELPPKLRQVIMLEPDKEGNAAIAKEQDFLSRHTDIREAIEKAKTSLDPRELQKRLMKMAKKLKQEGSSLFELRHEVAVAKVPAVVAHLQDALESSGKVVCFAHHRDVVSAIESAFDGQCVKLVGGMSMEEKQASVDAFQNDDGVKLFIGNMIAAGVGITLTAASHVVFAELDWVPGNLLQCEDRCHRIGQDDSVLVQHLVLNGSIDAMMTEIIVEKLGIIKEALDGVTEEAAREMTDKEKAELEIEINIAETFARANDVADNAKDDDTGGEGYLF